MVVFRRLSSPPPARHRGVRFGKSRHPIEKAPSLGAWDVGKVALNGAVFWSCFPAGYAWQMRNLTGLVSIAAFGLLPLLTATATHAQELRVDGFESGAAAGFQAGFVSGEMGAVRLTTPTNDTYRLDAVTLLFGPSSEQRNITLRIYEDNAFSGDFDQPGTPLFSGNFSLLGSAEQFSVIDISSEGIQVEGTFRVALQFNHDGSPAIARDTDGTVDSTRNFIFAEGFGWVSSSILGVNGDWVIRARVRNIGGGEEDAGPPVDAGPALDAGAPSRRLQASASSLAFGRRPR